MFAGLNLSYHRLAVGEEMTVIVNHTVLGFPIHVNICNATSCNQVRLFGSSPNGEMSYMTFSGGDKLAGGGFQYIEQVCVFRSENPDDLF